MSNPVFESRVDRWVAALLLAPIVVSFIAAIVLFTQGRPADASIIALTGAGVMIVTALFTVPCRYTFLADALSVRCGVICIHVPYDKMTSAKKSSTLRSGLALSLRRIVIRHEKGMVIISPQDREQFLELLRERCPQLADAARSLADGDNG